MLCITVAGAPDNDYQAVSGDIVQFNVGDTYQTHTIIINDDDECENNPNVFFSNLALNDGVQPINVINPRATVIIDDSEESECSEYCSQKFSNDGNLLCNGGSFWVCFRRHFALCKHFLQRLLCPSDVKYRVAAAFLEYDPLTIQHIQYLLGFSLPYLQGKWWVWNRHFSESRRMWVLLSCVPIFLLL